MYQDELNLSETTRKRCHLQRVPWSLLFLHVGGVPLCNGLDLDLYLYLPRPPSCHWDDQHRHRHRHLDFALPYNHHLDNLQTSGQLIQSSSRAWKRRMKETNECLRTEGVMAYKHTDFLSAGQWQLALPSRLCTYVHVRVCITSVKTVTSTLWLINVIHNDVITCNSPKKSCHVGVFMSCVNI